MARIILFIVLLALSSCTSKVETQLNELAEARSLWTKSAPSLSYSFDYTRHCFCPGFAPVRVRVARADIVAVSALDDSNPIHEGWIGNVPTIWKLYDEILRLIERSTAEGTSLHVEYDLAYGYPTIIDWKDDRVADAGFRVMVGNLVVE